MCQHEGMQSVTTILQKGPSMLPCAQQGTVSTFQANSHVKYAELAVRILACMTEV